LLLLVECPKDLDYNSGPMNINSIVDELTQQRDRISAAITALTGTNHVQPKPSTTERKKRNKLSAAAKRRMSLAMKARWAKAKKAGKNAL
jgi:hypothetical protein